MPDRVLLGAVQRNAESSEGRRAVFKQTVNGQLKQLKQSQNLQRQLQGLQAHLLLKQFQLQPQRQLNTQENGAFVSLFGPLISFKP